MAGYLVSGEKHNCCGCSACYASCPKQCITMEADEEGYLYPVVEQAICSGCGLCQKVCPLQQGGFHFLPAVKAKGYAAWNQERDVRYSSSSGGVFSALSDVVLEEEGVVYGAYFDEGFTVCHGSAQTKVERDRFKGSKYVQSKMDKTYEQVKAHLTAKRHVLFTGTPCQVAGLYSYLGRDDDFLCTAEIICHGVPSPKLFEDYLKDLCEKFHSEICAINFRDKEKGWGSYFLKIEFKNGSIYKSKALDDLFYRLFLKKYFVRPACYHCIYKKMPREADLTLGDFWSNRNVNSLADASKGVSFLLVNSKKGQELLSASQEKLVCRSVSLEIALQENLQGARMEPRNRTAFFQDYLRGGYHTLQWKYYLFPLVQEFPERSWKRVKKIIYKIW